MTINDLLGAEINNLQDYDEYRSKVLYIAEEHFDGNLIMLVHCLAGMVEQLGADLSAVCIGSTHRCNLCSHNGEPEESRACSKCHTNVNRIWQGWEWGGSDEFSVQEKRSRLS